jgi:serine/threonine protein kinase
VVVKKGARREGAAGPPLAPTETELPIPGSLPLPTETDSPICIPRPAPAEWRQGGTLNEEFVVEEVLGNGGYGVVLKVRHVLTGAAHAAKRIGGDQGYRKALQELRAWVELPQHPHIMPFGFCRLVDDYLVLFTGVAEGGSLADRVKREKPSPTRVRKWLVEVASGLAGAHESGVVHRDVKPGNVLLAADDTAKITDFGISRIGGREAGRGGTPRYRPPEQREDAAAGAKTVDVFAWGALALELLLGEACWKEGADALPELQARRDELPEDLVELVGRCLAHPPEHRPRDMIEVLGGLDPERAREIRHPWMQLMPSGNWPERARELGHPWRQLRPSVNWLAVDAARPHTSASAKAVEQLLDLQHVEARLAEGTHPPVILAEHYAERAAAHHALGDVAGALLVFSKAHAILAPIFQQPHTDLLAIAYARLNLLEAELQAALGQTERALSVARTASAILIGELVRDPQTYRLLKDAVRKDGFAHEFLANPPQELSPEFTRKGSRLVDSYLASQALTVGLLRAAGRTEEAVPLALVTLRHGHLLIAARNRVDASVLLLEQFIDIATAVELPSGTSKTLEFLMRWVDEVGSDLPTTVKTRHLCIDRVLGEAEVLLADFARRDGRPEAMASHSSNALRYFLDAADADPIHAPRLCEAWLGTASYLVNAAAPTSGAERAALLDGARRSWASAVAAVRRIADAYDKLRAMVDVELCRASIGALEGDPEAAAQSLSAHALAERLVAHVNDGTVICWWIRATRRHVWNLRRARTGSSEELQAIAALERRVEAAAARIYRPDLAPAGWSHDSPSDDHSNP